MKIDVKRGHHSPIVMGLQDGAFIFRGGGGLEVYIPSQEQPSEELQIAILLSWLVRRPNIIAELQERQSEELKHLADVRQRLDDPNLTVTFASDSAVEALEPETSRIKHALEAVCDIEGIWLSNESCLSELRPAEMPTWEYQARLAIQLGVPLDLKDANDNTVVKLALRLRRATQLGGMS